ncbi:MAG: C4-dicarboxylate ABC transporter [Methylococcaceae bacterium]|nr:C4-dicarboxylate ABC transporter [Methylococcaceae bacterium]
MFITCLLCMPVSQATTEISLGIKEIKTTQWRLQNVHLALSDLQQPMQALELRAERLELPSPFDAVRVFNVRCARFNLQTQELQCHEGNVEVKLNNLTVSPVKFSFSMGAQQSELQLTDLHFANGRVDLKATEHNGQWQTLITARQIALAELQTVFKLQQLNLKKGTLSLQLKLEGRGVEPANASLKMQLNAATLQGGEGRYALEGAKLDVYMNAQPLANAWTWQSHLAFSKGALYCDPIYLAAAARDIELDTVGKWSPTPQQLQVDYFQVIHPGVATLSGEATLAFANPKWLSAAELNLQAQDLKQLTTVYNSPFWVGSAFEGITLAGKLRAKMALTQQALTALKLDFEQVALNDPKQRFGLVDAKAAISWSKQAGFSQNASVEWGKLQFYALPLGKTKLNVNVKADAIALLNPVRIGLLGGDFEVKQLAWQMRPAQTPDLHFSGALHKVSLAQLTKALDWTPLTGTLSGAIPGISYHQNRLDLEGALTVKVFDGEINIKQLAVANLLSEVPKFYSDINIERLDLKQLTGKFKFGSIDGLLSGFVHDLYLENWQPISFYAWLGTPEGDDSAHRISQKAVDNISKIGGNGATDLISRSVLGLFDAFGYEQLGLGCYLHAGVCQLMGVAPAKNGYYMVKGGGLPRIDVLGYNPRVDWKVLVDRLGRIGKPNDMVVQ